MLNELFINNLGSLRNFSNKDYPFQKGNIIIHGMNGSGKSQISAVLQKISKLKEANSLGGAHVEHVTGEVIDYFVRRKSKEANLQDKISIEIDDFQCQIDCQNKTLFQTGDYPKIHVFNEEYIYDNVGDTVILEDKNIKIGEKNQERETLQNEIKKNESALKKVVKSIHDLIEKYQKDTGYYGQARTNKNISLENYLLEENPGVENESAKSQLENLSNPPEQINFHLSVHIPSFELGNDEKDSIETIFSNAYLEPKLTQEFYSVFIKTNKSFYKNGVSMFKEDKKKCPFCLTPKDENDSNIVELINYIDSTYNEKVESVNSYITELKNYRIQISHFLEKWNSHIGNINEKANLIGIKEEIEELTFPDEAYQKLLEIVENKAANMVLKNEDLGLENSICASFDSIFSVFNENYDTHVEFIKNINSGIDKKSSKKQALGLQIIQHQMHQLWTQNALRDRKKELEDELEEMKQKFEKLSASASNDSIKDFFNQIIKFLGVYKYELDDSSSIILKIENNYDISQEGYRISTGERKFIAMSYFFAEVLASVENSTDLKNIAIIVDDPIDSSDYQKFYSFISVIENFNNILQTIYRNKEIELGQLIILTHNALLYERLINTNNVCHYQIAQVDSKTELSKPKKKVGLTTFSSYIKKVTNYIKRMETSNNKDIGNYIRRILEIIASVENIENNKIENLSAYSKLNALSNHLSHESLERILDPIPETHEYVEACIELIELIKTRIPALYFTILNNHLNNKEIEEYRKDYNKLFIQN